MRCLFWGGATFRLIGIFLLLIPSPAVAALVPRRAAKHHGGKSVLDDAAVKQFKPKASIFNGDTGNVG